ncbi:sulfate ABC transporter permease subunit CysT [Neisseria sp. Ec49-e6-T10]|uniref:sulfate ABC transporter permease subunit CysT n=1 Tax=Neisseria sp. Ec49-e6-T10 TaxID=3140744 RepID=UPI003EBF7A20
MSLLKSHSVLPGFNIGLGMSVAWLTLMVLLPFVMLALNVSEMSLADFYSTISDERVIASIKLSFKMAFWATVVNALFGFLIAWVLVRYQFFGKTMINALIDLPFALPTAVAGIALATLYAPNGWIGQFFAPDGMIGQFFQPDGIEIAFKPIGIWIALVFVSLPFTVRSLQPVLAELEPELEEAASSLGASRFTVIRKIIIPSLLPALLTGAGMGFARATGEFGSVIFIAGNIPLVSEIAPLIIISKLDQYDTVGASAVALLMLVISFVILFFINLLQWHLNRKLGIK